MHPLAMPRRAAYPQDAGCGCAPPAAARPAPPSPGSSFASAVAVRSVEAEYEWLSSSAPAGWSATRQELVSRDGRSYDVVHVRWPDGRQAAYHFDVTDLLGAQRSYAAAAAGLEIDAADGSLTVRSGRPPCTLPSADSACRLMGGDLSALPTAALHTAGRALIISVGIFAAGERDPKALARYSLGAALAIEAFALAWAAAHHSGR